MAHVVLIGTDETKAEELGYLGAALGRHGLDVSRIDVSLRAGGSQLSGTEKLNRMAGCVSTAQAELARRLGGVDAVVGLGGGTGGEIVLSVLKSLPASFPKVLITTLAFDPRAALADTAITLVPTLCDIEGLNATLRQVFENTAAMVAGLTRSETAVPSGQPGVAVTTLGATRAAGAQVAEALRATGYEATVFHANGFGGAAFTRFVTEGHVQAVIDLNVHELGRLRLAGAHVPMQRRFTAAAGMPRIVLPGALNFLGLGEIETLVPEHRLRPHYRHSAFFTHVKLTGAEMAAQAAELSRLLNASQAPCQVLVPMGGFSHEDRPGGAIEDPELRRIAAEVLEAEARAYAVSRIDTHINDPATAKAAVAALLAVQSDRSDARARDSIS